MAEADESDGSFLKLSPVITVITNIDNDHIDFYGNMAHLREAFAQFADKVPYYGRVILCSDDAEARSLLPQLQSPISPTASAPRQKRLPPICKSRSIALTEGLPLHHHGMEPTRLKLNSR